MMAARLHTAIAAGAVAFFGAVSAVEVAAASRQQTRGIAGGRALLDRYCVGCHNARTATAGLALDAADPDKVADRPEIWEKVVRKLRTDIRPARFGQVDNLVTRATDIGRQTEVYNGFDVTLNVRFGQGGLLQGGMNTGKTVTNNCDVVDSPQQERFCEVAQPWKAQMQWKFAGSYPLPFGFSASGTFQNLPGLPLSALYTARNAEIAPSLGRNLAAGSNGTASVELLQPFTMFENRINQLDVRLTKAFKFGRARLQGMVDVYNILNASPILVVNTVYGVNWRRPTQILGARLFKFGAQLDW